MTTTDDFDSEEFDDGHVRGNQSVWGGVFYAGAAVVAFVAFATIVWNVAAQSETLGPMIQGTLPNGAALESKLSGSNADPESDRVGIATSMVSTIEAFQLVESKRSMQREFTGIFRATQASDLGFNRIGTIEQVHVEAGDAVKQGQALITLNVAQIRSDIAVLAARKQVELARLSELVAGPRAETIASARAELKEFEALRDQAQMTAERSIALSRDNAIARQEVDNSRMQWEASENRVAAARQKLNELLAGTRKEKIAAQKALISQLDADIASMDVKVDESRITAPFNGVVSVRHVDKGAIVLPGAIVIRLVEDKPPEAWIGLPPRIAQNLSHDLTYKLLIDNQNCSGRFKSLIPELEQMTRTQTAIFTLPTNSDSTSLEAQVHPTMGGVVKLELDIPETTDGFWVPRTALTTGQSSAWAVLVIGDADDDGRVRQALDNDNGGDTAIRRVLKRDVSVALVDSDSVLVRGDLKAGDKLVSAGGQKLTSGQRVRIHIPKGEQTATTLREFEPGARDASPALTSSMGLELSLEKNQVSAEIHESFFTSDQIASPQNTVARPLLVPQNAAPFPVRDWSKPTETKENVGQGRSPDERQ